MTTPGGTSIDHPNFRRLGLNLRGRRLLVVTVASVCILVAAGTASALVASNPSRTLVGKNAATSIAPWVTPSNEVNAPVVATAGGASAGSGNFNAISCVSATQCVAVGGDNNLNGLAAIFSKAGGTWSESTVASGLPELNAVDCPTTATCVAVGIAGASTSTDGGATWQAHTIPAPSTTLLGVSCATSSTCVAVGVSPGNAGPYFGQVLLTMNSGASWTVPSLPSSVGALGSVDCPSTTFCVAVGDQILVSDDGGQTWSARFVNGGTGVLRSVSCSTSSHCIAIGPNPDGVNNPTDGAFAIASVNGGSTWNPVPMPAGGSTLTTIQCFAGTNCVAGGPSPPGTGSALLFQSSSSGTSWAQEPLTGGLSAVSSISCSSSTTCVFVGRQGSSPIASELNNDIQGATVPVTSVVTSQNASAQ